MARPRDPGPPGGRGRPARPPAVERAYRDHWARVLALLAKQLRSLELAEDCLQEAFVAAVDRWERTGPPANPAGWLLTTARWRAIDRLRSEAAATRRLPLLAVGPGAGSSSGDGSGADPDADPGEWEPPPVIPDERLRLVFTCCHPALAREARLALTLRYVAGLTTPEIARLFLVKEATMAARLTRAKRKVAAAGIPYRVPGPADLPGRLDGVLGVLYLLFTEGYTPAAGDRLVRDEVAGEAIRLGRVVAELLPDEPEAVALLALMVLHHSRRAARRGPGGDLVRLPDQDRSRWHADEVAEGLSLLGTAVALADTPGPYLLQAAIAGEHARAATAEATDWPTIAALYARLDARTGSAVVRLNRAVAVAEAGDPAAGLALLDGLDEDLGRYHRLPAVRAELLRRLDRVAEATAAYDEAIARASNEVERTHLLRRRSDPG